MDKININRYCMKTYNFFHIPFSALDKYQQLLYENLTLPAHLALSSSDKYQQLLYKKRLVIVIFL